MTIEEILSKRTLIDFQVWLDPVLCWSMRARYEGRDIAWINGGTTDQLMNRFKELKFMTYVNAARGY